MKPGPIEQNIIVDTTWNLKYWQVQLVVIADSHGLFSCQVCVRACAFVRDVHTCLSVCMCMCACVLVCTCYAGVWHTEIDGKHEKIVLVGNVDELSIMWKVNGDMKRKLDWSWGGYEHVFTLAGGHSKQILRWRPTTRHNLFDDDHIVWTAYDTKHSRVKSMGVIVYVREKRNLMYFQNMEISDWCP